MSSGTVSPSPAPSVVVAPNIWVRKTRRTHRFAALALIWSFGFAAIAFLPGDHWHKPLGDYLGEGAFCFALAAVGLVLARRLLNAGLWLGIDGVVVRNPLRTHLVPLHDAESFVAGVTASSGNGTPCPILRCQHGTIGVWALGREGFIWSFRRYQHELEPLCDELNRVLGTLKA